MLPFLINKLSRLVIIYQVQKTIPLGHWIEEVCQIFFCREHCKLFTKSCSIWFVSICKFDSSKSLLQLILACLNSTLNGKDLLCWYKWKRWFPWAIAAAQAAENHRDEWGLTRSLQWGIYTLIPTWFHSKNSVKGVKATSLKISTHGTSPKW